MSYDEIDFMYQLEMQTIIIIKTGHMFSQKIKHICWTQSTKDTTETTLLLLPWIEPKQGLVSAFEVYCY